MLFYCFVIVIVMMIIVTSEEDVASQTIKNHLLKEFEFKEEGSFEGNAVFIYNTNVKLITIKDKLIESDYLSEHFSPNLFIYASRHKAKSEMPALLVHSTGNWGNDNSFGGKKKSISISSAKAVKLAYLELKKQKKALNLSDFDITMEVTHHGPTENKVPLVFIELGSSEKYWTHEKGALAVANAIMKVIKEFDKVNFKNVMGFGGTHYCSNFNKLQERNAEVAIGHVIPKHAIDDVNEELMLQAYKKSQAEYCVIDYKGTNSAQKNKIREFASKNGLKIKKIKEIL